MNKLLILFLQYDIEKYPDSFQLAKGLIDQIPNCHKQYIIIDNKHEGLWSKQVAENVFCVGGDNSDWEFSAWQKVFDNAQAEEIDCDAILFLNDAFMAYGWTPLTGLKDCDCVAQVKGTKKIVGQIDTKGVNLEAFGFDVSQWICTNCFLTTPELIRSLKSLVSVDSQLLESVIGAEYQVPYFKNEAPVNEAYKQMCINWLTQEWHSKMNVNETTWAFFRNKVKAMLNESLLTAKIKAMNGVAMSYKDLCPFALDKNIVE